MTGESLLVGVLGIALVAGGSSARRSDKCQLVLAILHADVSEPGPRGREPTKYIEGLAEDCAKGQPGDPAPVSVLISTDGGRMVEFLDRGDQCSDKVFRAARGVGSKCLDQVNLYLEPMPTGFRFGAHSSPGYCGGAGSASIYLCGSVQGTAERVDGGWDIKASL